MQNSFSFVIAFLFFQSCVSSNAPVEDALFQCLVDEYAAQGVIIEPVLDRLENYYVLHEVLNSTNALSKIEYYEGIAKSGEVPTMEPYALADSIAQINISIFDIEACIMKSGIDSLLLKESKYYKLSEAAQKTGGLTPSLAAKIHTDVLDVNDFSHPYYRAHMLLTYTRIYDRPSAFIRKTPR